MNCLLVKSRPEAGDQEIVSFLRRHQVEVDTAEDQWSAVHKAHRTHYDVVILNAEKQSPIDGAIRLLQDCNPKVRIIVRAEDNSRDLESAVRKEKIFYYHLNSFDTKDITTALSYALGLSSRSDG